MDPVLATFIDRLHAAFLEGDADVEFKVPESENVQCLQAFFQAIADGDFEGALACLTEDIELSIPGAPSVPFTGRWQGKSAVTMALGQNLSQVEQKHPEVQSVTAQGDTVVVVARERGRFRSTGRQYDAHWMQQYTFRDGKIARCLELMDSLAMREAARPSIPAQRGAGQREM